MKSEIMSQEDLQRFFRYGFAKPTPIMDLSGEELEQLCEEIITVQSKEGSSQRGYCPRENQPYTREMRKLTRVENAFHRIKLRADAEGWKTYLSHPCAEHNEYILTFYGGIGQLCVYFYSPITQEGASMMTRNGEMTLNKYFESMSEFNRYFRS